MALIQVTFEHKGKSYKGHLKRMPGAGGNLYHLMIKNTYQGQLNKTERFGWQFHTQHNEGAHLSEQFGKAVEEAEKSRV